MTAGDFIIEGEGCPGDSTDIVCPACDWREMLSYTHTLDDLRAWAQQHIDEAHRSAGSTWP